MPHMPANIGLILQSRSSELKGSLAQDYPRHQQGRRRYQFSKGHGIVFKRTGYCFSRDDEFIQVHCTVLFKAPGINILIQNNSPLIGLRYAREYNVRLLFFILDICIPEKAPALLIHWRQAARGSPNFCTSWKRWRPCRWGSAEMTRAVVYLSPLPFWVWDNQPGNKTYPLVIHQLPGKDWVNSQEQASFCLRPVQQVECCCCRSRRPIVK